MTTPAVPGGGGVFAGGTAPPPPPPPPANASPAALALAFSASATGSATSPSGSGTSPAVRPLSFTARATGTFATGGTSGIPVFDHIVMVIEENHGYTQIVGSPNAPYINTLIAAGALFTDSHGGPDVLHPSFPNYMQLFSGATQGTTKDDCPPPGSPYFTANMASSLIAAGKTFKGFAESFPASHTACGPSPYAGRHVPWVWWSNVAANLAVDFSTFPTTSGGYAALPTVSLVVPDLSHDMHSFGSLTDVQTIQMGDAWLSAHIDGYYQWAKTNNSLLIVQFDEDNFTTADRVPTVFAGAHVKHGLYAEHITHYNVLRTIMDAYGAARPGGSAAAAPILDCWN